jgi:hypothetical protein
MSTKFYVTPSGTYLGGFSEGNPSIPNDAIEVPDAPPDAFHTWDGASWTLSNAQLAAYLADYRWQRETGNIVYSGVPIATDDRSKMLLSSIQKEIADRNDPTHTRAVKTIVGFINLTDAQLSALYAAVIAHVQKCFDSEEATLTLINNNTVTTYAGVEAAFDAAYSA